MDTPPPLPPEVEAALEHERVLVEKPEIVRARLVARARESLRFPAAGTPKTGSLPSPLRAVWYAAAAVLVISATAVAVQLLRGPGEPAPVEPPVEEVLPAPEPEPQAIPPAPSEAPATANTQDEAAAAPPRAASTGRPESMVEELRFLERARDADARGDFAAVLAIAAEHERRFVHGRLAEEREVLRVKAFVGLGRAGDARATAAKFRRQFPRSVLLGKLDTLLEGMH